MIACSGGGSKPAATATPAAQVTVRPTLAASTPTTSILPTAVSAPTAPPAAGGPASDACGLVTKDDAAAALGEPVQDPKGSSTGARQLAPGVSVSGSACSFGSTTSARDLTVNLYRGSGAVSAQARTLVEQTLCSSKERVSGLGDVACWNDSSHTELQFLKGSQFVDIQITQASGPDTTQALTALARKAAGRMP
jgi:hypothetical protein